jgi:hypothetical protein
MDMDPSSKPWLQWIQMSIAGHSFKTHLAFRQTDKSLVSSDLHRYVPKQAQLLRLVSMNTLIVILLFLKPWLHSDILLYIFINTI